MQWAKKQIGFTIVELLIVVVVIAILAAITIVAYNGISNRAKQSAAQSLVEQVNKKILAYAVLNNEQYPADLDTIGISSSDQANLQYSVNNSASPPTYGLTGTNGTYSYYVSNTVSQPTAGGYAGHSANGVTAITNLSTNPSLESNANDFNVANGSTIARSTAAAIFGTNGLRVTTPSGGIADSGVRIFYTSGLSSGQKMFFSVSVRAITAGTYRLSLQGTAVGGSSSFSQPITLSANQVGRITYSMTTTAAGDITAYVLRTTTTASTFDVDGVMAVKGDVTSGYADGDTNGWVWNSSQNNSTSTGLPI